MKKIAVTVDKGEYCISLAGNVRLVSNDILKVYAETILLSNGKLKSECDFKDSEIKKDLLGIDEIVKSSKRFLKNYKHVKKASALPIPTKTTKQRLQRSEPQQQAQVPSQQPRQRVRGVATNEVELCKVSNGYYRKYLKNNANVSATVKNRESNINLPNGKTGWEFSLYCNLPDIQNAKAAIEAALPKKDNQTMAFQGKPIVWLR